MKRHALALDLLLATLALAGCAERIEGGPPVAEVAADPWVLAGSLADPAAAQFASCAACHMADASGRSDGTIPRLAGQHAAVIAEKLRKLRDGHTDLPVMLPFARALTDAETNSIAAYVARMPATIAGATDLPAPPEYAALCVACHGRDGDGIAGLYAPRLCQQHEPYLARRLDEIALNARGDADPAMAAIVASLSPDRRAALAAWLAHTTCATGGDG